MSRAERDGSGTAAELRRAFDESFARAIASEPEQRLDFLKIRCGGDPYAVPLLDVRGLHVDRKITRLPTQVSELLGLCGFRGVAVPIFDLRSLLGYETGPALRWLMLAGDASLVGLAFDAFERHVRVSKNDLLLSVNQETRPFVQGNVRDGNVTLPVLRMSSILERIMQEGDECP